MKAPNNLFVYGSMLSPDVVRAITGENISTSDAYIKNFSRRKLKDRDYPAIIQHEGGIVIGKILHDVREELVQLIDVFEGDEYGKKEVLAILKDDTELNAYTYIWNGNSTDVQMEDWDFMHFESHKLRTFLLQTLDIMSGNPLKENYND